MRADAHMPLARALQRACGGTFAGARGELAMLTQYGFELAAPEVCVCRPPPSASHWPSGAASAEILKYTLYRIQIELR